jgi:hypothetical protein
MICHFCNREAVAKCASCGLAICADHGKRYCQVCSNAVFSQEDASSERPGRAYLQCPPKPGMPTIYLDDDGPPECYRCQALARKVCQNCHNLYCREHAGKGEWCDQCTRGARFANWLTGAMVVTVVGSALLFYLLGQFEALR